MIVRKKKVEDKNVQKVKIDRKREIRRDEKWYEFKEWSGRAGGEIEEWIQDSFVAEDRYLISERDSGRGWGCVAEPNNP